MKEKENSSVSEDGNWNNAKRFSDEKIQGILESTDKYEDIATFGFSTLDDKLKSDFSVNKINKNKIEGLRFLVHKLLQVLGNSDFAIINKRDDALKYQKHLRVIDSFINPTSGKFNIHKNDYSILLKFVKNIKSKINTPLNKNNLIFMNRQEIDIEEQIKQDEEDFINMP